MKVRAVSHHVTFKNLSNLNDPEVSFQHFWGEVTTSCKSNSAGARILMRNQTIAAGHQLSQGAVADHPAA